MLNYVFLYSYRTNIEKTKILSLIENEKETEIKLCNISEPKKTFVNLNFFLIHNNKLYVVAFITWII